MSNIKTFVFGETSTDRINDEDLDSNRRMDDVTKSLIRRHGHLSNNRKSIKIYVGRAEVEQKNPSEGVSYRRLHTLYWSTNKTTAMSMAKKNLLAELKQ